MIKQLIKDIAFDNIKLSQCLTRSKLVANKIKNNVFKQWLNKELEGYEFDDNLLPSYRKIWTTINLTAKFSYGRTMTFPVSLPDSFGENILDLINNHRIIEPIAIVEQQIEIIGDIKGYIHLPIQQVQMLAEFYKDQISKHSGAICSGEREIGKVQYQNVLEQTKQKLLDTLMQLDDEFPNLIDEYTMTTENKEKVQNIVTNNIYGNNNPMNIATGVDVAMNITYQKISNTDEETLKSYGVSQDEIEDLKKIIEKSSNDKQTLVTKAMKWLGNVTVSVAGKGIYENIPQITDFIHKLIQ